ncbi:glycosyltransferase family 8 protein, partial [Campylobacter jejuni]|nr:hypothetical protein [Campylobacter jejuni]
MKKNKIHICLTVDDNYSKYLSVVICSILKNSHKDIDLFFYILTNGISQINKEKIALLKYIKYFSISYIFIDETYISDIPNSSQKHIKNCTNFRFFTAKALQNIDKCIFLDADLIVESNLLDLWNTDIDDYFMACVPDMYPRIYKDNWTNNLPLNGSIYVNTGVCLFNLKKWRENNVEQKFFINSALYYKLLYYPDQDILNITFQNKIKYLNEQWNTIVMFKHNHIPQIIHWAGYEKPWKFPNIIYADKFWFYAQFTAFYELILFDNIIVNNNNLTIENKMVGAVKIVENHLSYKIGKKIIHSKGLINILLLPFSIICIYFNHYLEKYIYNISIKYNPNSKRIKLEEYSDYD